MLQPHIRCSEGDLAENVFLPGDPNRIPLITQHWSEVKEVANNRGLLAVTGTYNNIPVSAVATGMGCPSAAIVIEELANIGIKRMIRIGTCGALKKEIQPQDLIIPHSAIRAEGTTREYLPPEFPAIADPDVFQALVAAAKAQSATFHTGVNRTHDSFYEPAENLIRWGNILNDSRMRDWKYPLVSSEMECSAVFFLGLLRGVQAGTILCVNTTEPLDEIQKNPDLIYQLAPPSNTNSGLEKAILIAHEAMERVIKNNA